MRGKLDTPVRSEHGFCPLLSGRIMPKPTGTITPSNVIAMEPVILDCPGNGCQWWSSADGCCCVRSVSYLAQIDSLSAVLRLLTESLAPPSAKSGGSPLLRIADALEEIVKLRKP